MSSSSLEALLCLHAGPSWVWSILRMLLARPRASRDVQDRDRPRTGGIPANESRNVIYFLPITNRIPWNNEASVVRVALHETRESSSMAQSRLMHTHPKPKLADDAAVRLIEQLLVQKAPARQWIVTWNMHHVEIHWTCLNWWYTFLVRFDPCGLGD